MSKNFLTKYQDFAVRIIYLSLILACSLIEAKISVIAHYFGQPEFIKYQYLFFKRNLLDDYEFIVFEDSNDPNISKQIQSECQKYDIKYVQIPRFEFEQPKLPIQDEYIALTSPSFQCSLATQYIYDHYVLFSNDICLILDNDIFLLCPFSIEKYLGTSAFAYVHEEKKDFDKPVSYMLPNFIILNPLMMPEKEQLDFNMGIILGNRTDSGGYTHFYLLKYAPLGKMIPKHYLHNTSSNLKDQFGDQCSLLFNCKEWGAHCFLEKDIFLHMRMGSNWSLHPNYLQMKKELSFLFDSLLAEEKP